MTNGSRQNSVENQTPDDKFVPSSDSPTTVDFGSLNLYQGLKDYVNSSVTQTNNLEEQGLLPTVLLSDVDTDVEGPDTRSANHYEQHSFTSTEDDTDPFQAAVDGMLGSGDEYLQGRGQRLQDMLNSDNPVDNASARAVINMLESDEYHQIASDMIDLFGTNEINTMVQLLNDPDRTAEASVVLGLMTGEEGRISGAFSAQRLLGMIGSTDGDTRASGERLLSMLGNEDDAPLANALLGLDNASIQQFLEIYDDPDQEELANQLTDLLTSENNTEVRAGAGILSMMTSDDGSERYAGNTLAEMLLESDERDTAITIAGTLDSPQQRLQMLALLENPAGERLVEMLGNEDQSRSAVTLLNLLASPFEVDRRDGGNLLNMLSTNATDAERVLGMSDPQARHHLTEMLANPATQAAGTRLLDMLESSERLERAAARNFLQSMDSTNEPDRERNNRLTTLLSNENTAAAARTLMVAFRDQPAELSQSLTLLQNNPEQGRMVATMLSGTRQERNAARTLIEMRVNDQNRQPAPRGEQRLEGPGDGPGNQRPQGPRPSDQMMQMLANPAERPQALAILSTLDAQQSTTLMGIRATHPNAFERMTTMLQNGQEQPVRNLLQLANSPIIQGDRNKQNNGAITGAAPGSVESMQQILRMLNNPQDAQSRQTAETLMTHLSTPEQFSNMTRLLAAPGFQAEARQLTQMLTDPRRTGDASTILSNLTEPTQIRSMLTLLGDENRRREAQQVMRMLPEGGGAARLLDMLGSTTESTRQTGNNLLTMLGTDNYFDAQNILDSQASPAQSQILMDLLADRQTAPTARQLINRLGLEPAADQPGQNPVRIGATALLGMLEQNGATGQSARQILSMLGSPTEARQADAILSLGNPAAMQAVVGVLNDPNRRQAAEQLRSILGSTEPGSSPLVNLSALMSGNMQAEGARLLDMLNTPAQQAAGNAILRRINNPAQAQQMLQMLSQDATRPVAEQLLQMLQSPQNTTARAAENWLGVMTNPTDASRAGINHINEMLTDPQRREQAITMLNNLENDAQQRQLATLLGDSNNPGVRQVVEMLSSGNRRQIEGARNFLGLMTQESFNDRLGRDDAPPAVPTSSQLLQMLGNPETQARARDIIAAANSPDQLRTILQMSQNPQHVESANRIIAALRNPEQESTMRAVLNRIGDPDQLNQMVRLLHDPNYSRAAQELTSILQDDERNPFGVLNLMGMLADTNAATRQSARELLDMLNSNDDSDRARNAGDIIEAGLSPGSMTQLLNIMRNPALQHAAAEVMGLLREDDATARVLLDMLQSTTPAVQEEGRRLLSQLNAWSTSGFAIRALEQRVVRFASKP